MVEIIDSCSQFHFLIFIQTLTIWIDDGISLFMLCIWHYNSLGLLLGHMLSGIFFKFILTFEYTRQNCQLASILAINRIKICQFFFNSFHFNILLISLRLFYRSILTILSIKHSWLYLRSTSFLYLLLTVTVATSALWNYLAKDQSLLLGFIVKILCGVLLILR